MNANINSLKSELQKYRSLQIIYINTPPSSNNIEIKRYSIITQAVNTLRLLPRHGETYYKIIYYNYLSPKIYFNTYEILDTLKSDGIFLSYRTYFRYKKEALHLLSQIITAAL